MLYLASGITQPNTITLLPVAGLSNDTRLLWTVKWSTYLNKNTFSTKSEKGKTETKSI